MQLTDPPVSESGEAQESIELAGDESAAPKRKISTSTATLAALVVAALGGLWLMHARTGPAAARAEAADAEKTIRTFLGEGSKSVANMQAMLNDTEKVVETFRKFPAAAQVPLEDLNKNPFSEATAAGDKPVVPNVDTRKQERESAFEHAQLLRQKLQSIMYGQSQRACMFAGRFCNEGDVIDGFEIQKINPDNVIVKRNGFRFELKLQR